MALKSNKLTGLSLLGLMQIACILLLVFSLAPIFAGGYWIVDLFTHFRVQYLVISLLLVIGFILYKNKLYTAIAAICVFINAFYAMSVFTLQTNLTTERTSGAEKQSIKLFHANVLTSNTQYQKLIDQIKSENPDVVVLQEVDETWIDNLASLKTNFSYSIEEPRADNFGMALYSQLPIKDYEITLWSDFDLPNIIAEFEINQTPVLIIATHPPPPVNKSFYDARSSIFKSIATNVKENDMPTIVIGDLNTTEWSSSFDILLNGTELSNIQNGFMPTWPTNMPPLMIPIDHCLVSEEFSVLDIRTGDGFGSDHLPLVVELKF